MTRPPSSRARRTWRRWATTLTLAAVAVVTCAEPALADDDQPPAGDAPSMSWSVQPADEAGPDDRPGFELLIPADRQVSEHVAVTNRSDQPLTLTLYASDAFNTTEGGYDLLPADRAPVDVGTWVTLPVSRLTLEAGQTEVVPVTISVPVDATPGDHAGGIVASARSQGLDADGNVVNVDNRVGTRLYVRVPGETATSLGVSGVSARYESRAWGLRPGSVVVHYTLRNSGNLRSSGTEQVSLATPFGLFDTASALGEVPDLLPGQSIERTVRIEGVTAVGWSTADLVVSPGNQFLTASDGAAHASVRVWSPPWAALGVVLLGIVLLLLVVGARRRRRRALATAREEGRHAAELALAAALAGRSDRESLPSTPGTPATSRDDPVARPENDVTWGAPVSRR